MSAPDRFKGGRPPGRAAHATAQPCVSEPPPLVVERSPDRSTTTEPWHGQETVPQLGEPGVSEPPPVIPCEGETVERSAELPVVSPTAPVVAVPEPVRPTPPSEPVLPSLAAAPFVLSPTAVPTKEEAERAAEVARERQRVRRWPSG